MIKGQRQSIAKFSEIVYKSLSFGLILVFLFLGHTWFSAQWSLLVMNAQATVEHRMASARQVSYPLFYTYKSYLILEKTSNTQELLLACCEGIAPCSTKEILWCQGSNLSFSYAMDVH